MKTFLEYVAEDILQKFGTDLSHTAVVFPNKRAALFMNEALARIVGKPLWSPSYMTISELFRNHSKLRVADPIKLVCDLHKSFVGCTGINETLDHFYGWGQLLISDFDDVDKNMADPQKVFANVRDIHELDDVSYLTPEQIKILQQFFSNFSADHNSELKKRFLSLWSNFYDIFGDFNERLASQGLAYEGALYRKVATDETATFDYDRYFFVGFNMLQKVEQKLFDRLKSEGKAFFYWDLDNYYMPKKGNTNSEAGHFIAKYLEHYPNEIDLKRGDIYDNFSHEKAITYISAPTENIQARYLSTWLRQNNRIADGKRTAIVLANEGLLKTVIHCLPEELEKVNITTGYPLSNTPFSSLISNLINLQTAGYIPARNRYRLKYVNAVLRHPYISYITDSYGDLLNKINKLSKTFFPSREELSIDEGTTLLFSEVKGNEKFVSNMVKWLLEILRHIANYTPKASDPLFAESLFRTYTLVNRIDGLIESGDLDVDIITMERLLGQLISTTSVPFHGEPAVGVQVMGVLETRNLDFDHVIILSCNEGNMPKGVSDTSFIPYSIRKAYELTTVDNKVAIYAYYFYRLLQRATDITIVYNNSTDDGVKGEMSRFMLQMMVESGQSIKQLTLQAGQSPISSTPKPIEKTPVVMDIMKKRFPLLTPTAINKYMRCPLQFYYNYVGGIAEPDDEDDDTIDNRLFGNIFHAAAEKIYRKLMEKSHRINSADLQQIVRGKVDIERAVDEAMKEEYFKIKDKKAKMPELNGLQIINREVIITYLTRLLEIDSKFSSFEIIGLETDVTENIDIECDGNTFTTKIGGRIDRLDKIEQDGEERIRVVDYKTGSRTMKSLGAMEEIFSPEGQEKHADYYLQTFLYGLIVDNKSKELAGEKLPVSPALLFIQHASGDDFDPTLKFGKEPITDLAGYREEFMGNIHRIINEIFNPSQAFVPTTRLQTCASCPYNIFCSKL